MSKKKSVSKRSFRFFYPIFIVILIYLVYLIFSEKPGALPVLGNILIVAVGFGAVIMIHEFGHFIIAKISGIKCEAFSIGFPPTLLGFQKTRDGIRFRLLPKFFSKETGDDKDDGLIFKVGGGFKHSDTEYRISLVPFGGYVKMLGQDDTGPTKESDDPRSYANKPVFIRIAVVAAGVIFNAISAVLMFMMVFLIGVDLMPAVVGSVRPNSPAQIAGIAPRDRIIEIEGETFVDFLSLSMSTMLSEKGEPISLKVLHPDGTLEDLDVFAEESEGSLLPGKDLGIGQAESLSITKGLGSEDVELLYDISGLYPGDRVIAFNGEAVKDSWRLYELVGDSLRPDGVLKVIRTDMKTGRGSTVDVKMSLHLGHVNDNFETGYDLAHIYSMVPRLKIVSVPQGSNTKTLPDKLLTWWNEKVRDQEPQKEQESGPSLEVDDIIVQAGKAKNPTYTEFRKVTTEHVDKSLEMLVLRKDGNGQEHLVEVTVVPKRQAHSERVQIGVQVALDAEHPIVAKTIEIKNGPSALDIPRGARITAVDGEEVSSFYDIMGIIRKNFGQFISIDYHIPELNDRGGTGIVVPASHDYITAKTSFAAPVPFDYLKETYKADSAILAINMGLKKTKMFIVNSYLTLKGLLTREVGGKAVSGPVGIVTISYKIAATQSLTYYVYFLGLISSCLAVMNLLPLPVVDGGVILLLLIEKIKGSPINQKVQEIISYAGLFFIIALFLWLTYNDIYNMWLR